MTITSSGYSRTALDKLITGNRLRYEGNLQDALVVYQELATLADTNINIEAVVAILHFQLAMKNTNETGENYTQAITWLRQALTRQPNNAILHVALAEIYSLGMVEYQLAENEYREALKYNPDLVTALVGAAALYGTPDHGVTLDEAIQWMERAIKLRPDDADFHARLSDLYRDAGRTSDAQNEWILALLCPKPINPQFVQLP